MASLLAERLRQRSAASLARVVHVPQVLSATDIALVRSLKDVHHQRLGRPPPARAGWNTTYLSAGGLFRTAAPELHRRLGTLRKVVDLTPFEQTGGDHAAAAAAAAAELLGSLEPRCIELHDGHPGGSLNDPRHFDNGSMVTVDVMLDDGFTGGELGTLEADGSLQTHLFRAGDALVFPSNKYHSVGRILTGVRQTLVVEYWQGNENRCNHRCELVRPADGSPPHLCDDARTPGGCPDAVSASFEAEGPLGLGFGFADAADPSNIGGLTEAQVEDGRPVVVTANEVRPGTHAAEIMSSAQLNALATRDMVLTHVGGVAIGGLGFEAVDDALMRAVGRERPLKLWFARPGPDLSDEREQESDLL
jgi:hypothetical protein